jgi:hypothetical protein
MNKKIFIFIVTFTIVAIAVLNVNLNPKVNGLSDVSLANVEALAEKESIEGTTEIVCASCRDIYGNKGVINYCVDGSATCSATDGCGPGTCG